MPARGKKEKLFKKVDKYCENCGKLLKFNNNRDIIRKRFCSRTCIALYSYKNGLTSPPVYSGKNHPCWIDGRSKVKKFCKDCGKEISWQTTTNLCRTCFNKRKHRPFIAHCETCGKSYITLPYKYNHSKHHYCSKKCIKKQPGRELFICPQCNKEFKAYRSVRNGKLIFCSRECQSLYNGRKNRKTNIFYIDGRTPLRKLIKTSAKMDKWRNQIYERDNYKCIWCSYQGKDLHAHHLITFSELLTAFLEKHKYLDPEKNKNELLGFAENFSLFWDINNGITLCKECHNKEHGLLKGDQLFHKENHKRV